MSLFALMGIWSCIMGLADLRRRKRCRKCGRDWALQRNPGARRSGYVRSRCKYCGAEQRKIED
ncbi:MAG: hypothetical protein ACYS0K_17910 [Planctomycetota bacterium]